MPSNPSPNGSKRINMRYVDQEKAPAGTRIVVILALDAVIWLMVLVMLHAMFH